jgi:hypothetical protein
MTATNHMLTGAVVAVGLHHPLLIAPVAIASHFLLDVLPHFGVHHDDPIKRNKHPLFQFMVVVDVALSAALLALLPFILKGIISWWVLLLGMIFAFLPDVIWLTRFVHEIRYKRKYEEETWFSRFHHKIQWGERSWGVFVEIVFFGSMGVLLGALAA